MMHIHLVQDNKCEPLRPSFIASTSRSTAVEDFDEGALDTIAKLVSATTIPILRARFADILWIVRKDYKMAQRASVDYLEAFKRIDDGDAWAWEFECLKRGMGIARILGTEKRPFTDYVTFIEARLGELERTCA